LTNSGTDLYWTNALDGGTYWWLNQQRGSN
jgi:hypothetical protein